MTKPIAGGSGVAGMKVVLPHPGPSRPSGMTRFLEHERAWLPRGSGLGPDGLNGGTDGGAWARTTLMLSRLCGMETFEEPGGDECHLL